MVVDYLVVCEDDFVSRARTRSAEEKETWFLLITQLLKAIRILERARFSKLF